MTASNSYSELQDEFLWYIKIIQESYGHRIVDELYWKMGIHLYSTSIFHFDAFRLASFC